ncbi:siderophore-interacting protein [Cellulosimicrobium marinum]|uniref:siderophore-interacting protein n=1 Tax=Cellulosimicrobium marinum TaxID=1638992 RepID=UPI001E34E4F1|nr:siderophore-interacting protein [Cellulosimicrobium marinum]MCB7135956.1 siderophore-interacting protein [Cellulosimicrobium marinum]
MFTRPRTRFDLVPRRVRVHRVEQTSVALRRITFRDAAPVTPERGLASLQVPGPEDHVKVFLPDPATGELHAPSIAPDGGLQRPTGVVSISRDYTVRAWRALDDGTAEIDVDWVLHGDEGPASAWAARAAEGDELVLAGPRGSVGVPDGVGRLTVAVDETGLPAAARWVAAVRAADPAASVTAVVEIGDDVDESFVEAEVDGATTEILYRTDGPGQLAEAVRSLGGLADDELFVGAGEAGDLIPVRRYLRREAGARADQLALSGYWRRGVVNLDHHEPLDPTDPD